MTGGSPSYSARFSVPFEYEVHFTHHVFAPHNRVLLDALGRRERGKRQRCLVVLDAGLVAAWPQLEATIGAYAAAHAGELELAGPPLVVPGGEDAKNDLAHVVRVQRALADGGIDRHAFCVIAGGGAVLDMAGFAAATCHRGVRVLRLPTTVLGQNDSGVGVKNGVNAFGFKNFVGSFAPPFAVINDLEFLSTLSRRDRIAGMAEAVKVALVRDRPFFEWLCAHAAELAALEPAATAYMVERCARLHVEHICSSGDPFEFGSARPLDFGHWAAHKLEGLTQHRLRHGEAVGIGLALDTRYSCEVGLLGEADAAMIQRLLLDLGFQLYDRALELLDGAGQPRVLEGLREFQEHLGGELTVSLLRAPGDAVDTHHMDLAVIQRCIAWLAEQSRSLA
jgi:3-dehydroquinate synthase